MIGFDGVFKKFAGPIGILATRSGSSVRRKFWTISQIPIFIWARANFMPWWKIKEMRLVWGYLCRRLSFYAPRHILAPPPKLTSIPSSFHFLASPEMNLSGMNCKGFSKFNASWFVAATCIRTGVPCGISIGLAWSGWINWKVLVHCLTNMAIGGRRRRDSEKYFCYIWKWSFI